jgi:hypothetical protein
MRGRDEAMQAPTTRSMTPSRAFRRAVLIAFAVIACGSASAQDASRKTAGELPDLACGALFGLEGVGPCDVRVSTDSCARNPGIPDMLTSVQRNHFPPRVEQLVGPAGSFEPEIQYMLMVFPNHHRALMSLARLARKRQSDRIHGMTYTASCWMLRAATFAPDDARVREIFGLHLSNFGRKDDALKQFLAAEELGANDPNNMYNIGLLYYGKRDYDRALEYAKKAYGGGFQLPWLRDRLREAGKWRD